VAVAAERERGSEGTSTCCYEAVETCLMYVERKYGVHILIS
jgi:hypothetical protein